MYDIAALVKDPGLTISSAHQRGIRSQDHAWKNIQIVIMGLNIIIIVPQRIIQSGHVDWKDLM